MKLFNENKINYLFDLNIKLITREIQNSPVFKIMNDENSTIAKKISLSFQINPLKVNFNERKVIKEMVSISGLQIPIEYDMDPYKYHQCARVIYIYPFKGDMELLYCKPKAKTFNKTVSSRISENGKEFTIEFQTYGQSNKLDQELTEVENLMKEIIPIINKEVAEFNKLIPEIAFDLLKKRKIDILSNFNQDNNLLN